MSERLVVRRPLMQLAPGALLIVGLALIFVLPPAKARCDVLRATPADYRDKLAQLGPGDRLELEAGNYDGLALSGLNGQEGQPIEIVGPETGPPAVLVGRSCCNTISLRDSSYLVIKNLEVDNRGLEVDGVKVESNASFAHHITLENLYIHNFGANQQLVGISTKAPVWDFVIRGNIIEGAGTGLYLGDSDGSDPFIRGLIENNLVVNPIGYCMQIKHQAPRPSRPGMPTDPSVTVVRHNVFIKSANAATGDLARPNLLVGHFPTSGAGAQDRYDVYGNFFYENASGTEGLFQGEGNVSFYANVLVNRHGGGALIAPHYDVPKDVALFRNTIYVQGTGISISGGAAGFTQRAFQNAVFASNPIVGGMSTDNETGSVADAAAKVNAASFELGSMDFYPRTGQLEGNPVALEGYADRTQADLDFNGQGYDERQRGAYGGSGTNPGWSLADTKKDEVAPPVPSPDAGPRADASGPAPDAGTPGLDAASGGADAGASVGDAGLDDESSGGCQSVGGGDALHFGLFALLLGLLRRRRSALLPLAFVACASGDDQTPGDAPSYEADIRPILEARCVGCHQAGGIGPFALTSYELARDAATAALHAMETGRMPPWMPNPDCRHYVGERLLGPNDLPTFRAWVEAGGPRGEPTASAQRAAAPIADIAPFEPTHRLQAREPYLPERTLSDDYRCFLLEGEFDTERFVTASRVVPDRGELVHHVLVYAVDAAAAEALSELDGADGKVGYPCFGGPIATPEGGRSRLGATTLLGAWVPGSLPTIYGNDSGTRIGAGNRIVMQIHYNTLAAEVTADQSTLELRLETAPPSLLVSARPVAVLNLDIPPGDSKVVHEKSFLYAGPGPRVVAAAAGHMHLLGQRLLGTRITSQGEETCLLDIPRWDFGWQQSYRFLPGEELTLEPGDRVSLRCEHDNSAANQPVIGGVRAEPKRVAWGEGTTDEMCLMFLAHVEPYASSRPASCTGLSACRASCEGSTVQCLFDCEAADAACGTCALQSLVDCAGRSCSSSLSAIRSCLSDCGSSAAMLSTSLEACLRSTCAEGYETARSCLDGVIATGTCDADLSSCG